MKPTPAEINLLNSIKQGRLTDTELIEKCFLIELNSEEESLIHELINRFEGLVEQRNTSFQEAEKVRKQLYGTVEIVRGH